MRDEAYQEGFADGYRQGVAHEKAFHRVRDKSISELASNTPKRKRRQSKKQRLLSDMAGKAWARYKKGNGKKTYIQIRAQVSRSAEYKRKAKKL